MGKQTRIGQLSTQAIFQTSQIGWHIGRKPQFTAFDRVLYPDGGGMQGLPAEPVWQGGTLALQRSSRSLMVEPVTDQGQASFSGLNSNLML